MTSVATGVIAAIAVVLFTVAAVASRRAVLQTRARVRVAQGKSSRLSKQAIWIPTVIAVAAVIAFSSPLLLVVLAPMSAVAFTFVKQQMKARQLARYERSLPYVLDAIARSMRSGAGLLIAIEEAGNDLDGDVAADVASVATRACRGDDLSDSLRTWARERPVVSVELATTSMVLALKTGVAHAEVVDRVALTVRQSLNAAALAKTHATQARASMWALIVMPALFTGPMLVFDDGIRQFLLHSKFGISVLVAGIVLDALGALWMSRLTQRALS